MKLERTNEQTHSFSPKVSENLTRKKEVRQSSSFVFKESTGGVAAAAWGDTENDV